MATGTLKFKKVQMKTRVKNAEGNYVEQQKWYGRAAQDGTVGFEDFITHMSEHNSPYSRGVIHGVLTDMLDCLKEMVLNGKSVRFGDIGLFSLGMASEPADTRDDWTAAKVKGVHLIVRNTKTWSNAELRKKVTFRELASYVGEEKAPEGGGEEERPGEL
ncbi:MAG: DNA-binding protein [Parabacteroides sp.]|nr:DNA-binding protein [Parabacteroides sp.]